MLPSALLPVWQPSRRSASGKPGATGVSQSQGHLERPPASLCSSIRGAGPGFAPGFRAAECRFYSGAWSHSFGAAPPPQGLQGLWNSDGSKWQAECCLDSEMKGAVPCFGAAKRSVTLTNLRALETQSSPLNVDKRKASPDEASGLNQITQCISDFLFNDKTSVFPGRGQ